MANRDKHKKRSGYSYSKNQYGLAEFARRVAIRNEKVSHFKNFKEQMKTLFRKKTGDS